LIPTIAQSALCCPHSHSDIQTSKQGHRQTDRLKAELLLTATAALAATSATRWWSAGFWRSVVWPELDTICLKHTAQHL